jgi:hypothetical protein
LWYDSDGVGQTNTAVGMRMQWRRLPLGYLFRQTSPGFCGQVGEYYPLERRKEAISWRMHSPGVANVVKVIWFRFRILAARELLSSTKHGSVQTQLACTTSRSAMVISSLMNPLAMDLSIRIAVAVNRCDLFPGDFHFRQGISQTLQRFVVNRFARERRQKAEPFPFVYYFCLNQNRQL